MMMNKNNQERGMAGTIMVVLIFGFLMSISTAYIKMIQTETEVQSMIDQTDRAVDAAFSGINYAMAVTQTKKEMFDAAKALDRYYFVKNPPSNTYWTTALGLNCSTGGFTNLLFSDWCFLNDSLSLFDPGETATPPYRFRVHSFPGVSSPGTIAPASYTIKAQGQFRIYAADKKTIISTYSAQLIAQCEISFSRKVLQLKRWRHMSFEEDTSFFKATVY